MKLLRIYRIVIVLSIPLMLLASSSDVNYESSAQSVDGQRNITSLFVTILNGSVDTGWVNLTINAAPVYNQDVISGFAVNVNGDNVGFQYPLPATAIYPRNYVCVFVFSTAVNSCSPIESDANGIASASLSLS